MKRLLVPLFFLVLSAQPGCVALDFSRSDHESKAAEYNARMAHIESRLGQLEQFAGLVPPPAPNVNHEGEIKLASATTSISP